ncbi:MAG: septum formation initiator family protein [Chitinophagales bacterium]|nr:septum formation initiator family protein [Chitinophagaceae bacterium]MCB9063625.1 septum formation initiator family protein [Chitinophagales bacterium]
MKKVLRIATNKYLLTGIVFVVWVGYFDRNDWFTAREREDELENVKDNIAYLKTEIADMKKQKDGVQNDSATLEKFARERYHLKRENEDVYVFE